ncbi:MAG: quinone-dependent dihydroorotate dehydrogenase [Saprospirales bacterium]|nr:MAG: quinone-dependent dihydroorotate dehydrogenase [Saprospirales bacterium]
MYRSFLRPLLFSLPAEKAHHLAVNALKMSMKTPLLGAIMTCDPKRGKSVELMGLKFPNRLGLAAGFDKDGKSFKYLGRLGFGFLELGTVTPLPQEGNPKPRLFRLPADKAIINRMGFNNEGVQKLRSRLEKGRTSGIVIGGNIGKNKDTPNEEAVNDYLKCMKILHPIVDYFTVNMSSPNTPNLRELQDKEPLRKILSSLMQFNLSQTTPRPVLLKIAPDLSTHQLDDIVEIVLQEKLAGVVATNTTISRSGLKTATRKIESIGAGGLSGAPLAAQSLHVVEYLRKKMGSELVIIGVGGIMSLEDAEKMRSAGADLVQLYTGFVYEGPGLVRELVRGME